MRRVRKRYVAVVHGTITGDEGEVDVPIRKDMDSPPKQLVDPIQVAHLIKLQYTVQYSTVLNCT